MNSIYVFTGQGSQYVGMGKELFGRYSRLVAQADEVLGYSVKELCLKDPNRVLHQTQYTQPALYVVNILTYLDKVSGSRHDIGYLAGHSLGEYCALHIAGAFDFVTGLKLVSKRGELMSRAPKGAMIAVMGIDQNKVAQVLNGLPYKSIDIANTNSRHQSILSGAFEELRATNVQEALERAGASVFPLNVSAAFHSRCMKDVESEFEYYVGDVELAPLQASVVSNYTARPYPKSGYATYMTRQISNPVRWYESVSWLISQGYDRFEEIGPGNVLTKLCVKIGKDPMPIQDESPIAHKIGR